MAPFINGLRLSLAFLRVPRLFGFLFLFPLILSFFIVYFQLLVSGLFLSTVQTNTQGIKASMEKRRDGNVIRKILLRSDGILEPIQVCRWTVTAESGETEVPPPNCELDRFDIALKVPDPATFVVNDYERLLDGNFRRLHICATCEKSPEVLIDTTQNPVITNSYSFWGLLLLGFVELSKDRIEHVVKLHEEKDRIKRLIGTQLLYTSGFQKPTNITDISKTLLIIVNITALIMIALWLALKAHRKVLDYFSDSGALLPMVAATGKTTFYISLWALTLTRVGFFLIAAIPLCYINLAEMSKEPLGPLFFNGDTLAFVLWVIALASGMSFATLIASIADLRHRHSILSFLYRYVPLLLSMAGGLLWGLTFVVDNKTTETVRTVVAALPLIGMAPTLLAPIFIPEYTVLALNTLSTVALMALAARSNSRWFAAHLEEL